MYLVAETESKCSHGIMQTFCRNVRATAADYILQGDFACLADIRLASCAEAQSFVSLSSAAASPCHLQQQQQQ